MRRTLRTHSRRREERVSSLSRLALAAFALVATRGCAAQFDPPSKVESLRVLAVSVDRVDGSGDVVGGSYANPGDTVTFHMSYAPKATAPLTIAWLGGCYNPTGDAYYQCYSQLEDAQIAVGTPDFSITLPDTLVSDRPVPEAGPHYGIAYVFFLVCAGNIQPVTDDGTGRAGNFPIGCFDAATGARLGADSFVPGYTQVYAFEDGRTNANPIASAIKLDGVALDDGAPRPVARCALTEDERRVQGCGKEDPFASCTRYDIDIEIASDVAEEDPDAQNPDGTQLREAVWVDYFADAGDIDSDTKLVSDAATGYNPDHGTHWVPPDAPGPVTIWAVVHDARGGQSILERHVEVQ